jgi:hypothetical protein
MKKPVRMILLLAIAAAAAAVLPGCNKPASVTLVPAPPGPADLGPATGLSTPPQDAVVFDLKYRAQTGSADDLQYHSYWGYGGSSDAARNNSFLDDVRKRASGLYFVHNPSFKNREWAAVEYRRRQVLAFYFDVNGDGKLDENERILPTRKTGQGVEFITPDFTHRLENGAQTLGRTLLQVNFWGSEPNCMWSPAALLEATARLNGQAVRLLLFANGPAGEFGKYGSSTYAILSGPAGTKTAGQYVPRETLSSVICSEGQFYHLTVEGRRTNGLPARALVVKDTSPTGELAVTLAGSNSLHASLTSLYLHAVDDKTVFFRISSSKDKVSLPVGTYALDNGAATYGAARPNEWEVSFTKGPTATVQANKVREVRLGQPALKVRAIEEKNRYMSETAELAAFKQGTPIYLEPKIVGKDQEVFSRFRQATAARNEKADRPPRITITGANGKELLSRTMEYG